MSHQRLREYRLEEGAPDEVFRDDGSVKEPYRELIVALERDDPQGLLRRVRERVREREITFGTGAEDAFDLDPIPRLVSAEEWRRLELGLAQRARALNEFCADVYGAGRIVEAGVVPERVASGSPSFEARLQGYSPPGGVWTNLCGFDLVRGADGEMVVLEDNTRTPSGAAYILAAAEIVRGELADRSASPIPAASGLGLISEMLRSATPDCVLDPRIVVLSNGPQGAAYYEHRALAETLGFELATPSELEARGDRLHLNRDGERTPVDVIYRRTDDSRLERDDAFSELGELAFRPILAGRLGVVNAFGAGIADDKLAYAYVPAMIRFYLEQTPLLGSVRTYDPLDDEQLAAALDRLDELVLKPRLGEGGQGVLIAAAVDPPRRAEIVARLREQPGEHIAQERVALSTHPCISDDGFVPRRVDLRAFACATDAGFRVFPGGLTRYAPTRDSLIVNSSQGGGAKDTWIV